MNKLIDGLFERKMVVRILSVLTAVLLWFIVLDRNNPMTNRVISVPIMADQSILEDSNLRIIGTGAPFAVDVVIRGRSKKVNAVTANDFRVVLDYGKVQNSGAVSVALEEPEYLGDNHLRITGMNPSIVSLALERITGIEFPVRASWEGVLPEGYRAVNLRMDPATVILEDKESLVNRVESVVVILDASAPDKTTNLARRVLVLDSDGNAVSQFDGKITVAVSYDLVRTLPVATRISGTPALDWFVTGFRTSPQQVDVVGKFDTLSTLESVQAEAIDVEGKAGSFTQDIILTVPEGFNLFGTKPQVQAEVQMEKLVVQEVVVPVENIQIVGQEQLDAYTLRFIDEEVIVQVKGKSNELSVFNVSALRLSINVANVVEGEQTLPIQVQTPNGLTIIGTPTVRLAAELVPEDAEIPENPEGDVDPNAPAETEAP